MKQRTYAAALAISCAVAMLSSTGCVGLQSSTLGALSIPIPVSSYWQKLPEDNFWIKERYGRVPVLGPVSAGAPIEHLDAPSDDEVMRALEKARPTQGGLPFLYEVQRNNIRIFKDEIANYLDPPRVVPLIGPCQLHHVHYKCTIYFTEVKRVGWPVPHTLVDEEAVEVVYIDHNHFHMVGNVDPGRGTFY